MFTVQHIFVLLYVCLLHWSLGLIHPNIRTVVRPSYGVHFSPYPTAIVPTAGSVPATFVLDAPELSPIDTSIFDCDRFHKQPHLIADAFKWCRKDFVPPLNADWDGYRLFKQREKHIYAMADRVRLSLSSYSVSATHNSRRGLFNFIGSGMKYLFGTLSQGDLDQINGRFKTLYINVSKGQSDRRVIHTALRGLAASVDSRFKDLVQFVNASSRSIERVQSVLRASQHTLNRHGLLLFNMTLKMHRVQHSEMDLMFLQAHFALLMQEREIEKWQHALTDIALGRLPRSIITEKDLLRALRVADKYVKSMAPSLAVVQDSMILPRIYNLRTTRMQLVDKQVIFIVQVPIVRVGHAYDVYAVHAFPLPIPSSDGSPQQGYTTITNIASVLAVAKDMSDFFEMSIPDLELCMADDFGFCQSVDLIRSLDYPTCAFAVFFHLPVHKITQLCTQTLSLKPIPTTQRRLSDSYYMFTNLTDEILIRCGDSVTTVAPAPVVYVTVPCGCNLLHLGYYSLPAIASCRFNVSIEIAYPINYALISAFHLLDDDDIDAAFDSTALAPPLVDLPDLAAIVRLMNYNSSVSSELHDVIEVARTAESITRLPDDLLMAMALDPLATDLTSTIIRWTLYSWVGVLTLAVACLAYRLQRHREVLAALLPAARAQQLHALAPPSDRHVAPSFGKTTTPPVVPPSPTPLDAAHVELFQFTIHVLTAVALFFVIILMVRRACSFIAALCRPDPYSRQWLLPAPSSTGSFELFLKVDSFVLRVLKMPYEHGQTLILAHPLPRTLALSCCPWPHYDIRWDTAFSYMINEDIHLRQLQKRYYLSPLSWHTAHAASRRAGSRYLLYRTSHTNVFRTLPWIPHGGWDPASHLRNVIPESPHDSDDPTAPSAPVPPPMRAFQKIFLPPDSNVSSLRDASFYVHDSSASVSISPPPHVPYDTTAV